MAAAPLVVTLLPLLRAGADVRAALGPGLVVAATAVATAAVVTWLPVILVPALRRGGRQAVMPALLVGAAAGAAAVLSAPAAAEMLSTGRRLAPAEGLLPYAAAAAATLGLAGILAVHRLARVGGRGVALVGAAALPIGAAETLLPARPTLDDGVVGLVAAAAVLLVGLGTATLAGGPTKPRTDRLDLDAPAAARPAAVAPAGTVAFLLAMAAVGLVARLLIGASGGAADAATGRLVGGSFSAALDGSVSGAHPPLSVALVWWSRHLFGASGVALRLPSLLAGLLLVPAAFAAGRALYGRHAGLVAAAVAAVGPAFVWSSAGAGPAAVTALLVCLAVLGLVSALRHDHPVLWLLFGLATAAVVWSHQFGVVTVAVLHAAAGITVIRRFRAAAPEDGPSARRVAAVAGWAGAAAITVGAVVALVAWWGGPGSASTPPALEYATNAAPAGGHTPFGLAAGALSTVVGFHPPDVTSRLLALWPLCILAAFALFGRRWSSRGVLLIGLAAAPFVALLLADLAGAPRRPPLALDWLAPALPAVALAIGRAVDRLSATQARRLTAGVAVVAVLVLATADQTLRVASPAPTGSTAGPAAGPATAAPDPAPTTPRK